MTSDHTRPTARQWPRPAAFSLLLAILAGVTGLPARASAAPAGTVEGEQLTPDKGVIASTYRDTKASGGAVLGLWSSGAASTTVSTPALGSLAVRAKADLCNGAPTLELWVDGELLLSTPVGSTSWATYGVNASLPAGSHRIAVAFPNGRPHLRLRPQPQGRRAGAGHRRGGWLPAGAAADTTAAGR